MENAYTRIVLFYEMLVSGMTHVTYSLLSKNRKQNGGRLIVSISIIAFSNVTKLS